MELISNLFQTMEDETPWLQLASLALFKLFNDWQAQGYVIPAELLKNPNDPSNPAAPGSVNQDVAMNAVSGAPKPPKQPKKVPDNPTERHPVQLLNELRGGVVFSVVGKCFTFGIFDVKMLYEYFSCINF